jgi:Peptidase of plants and bacteria
MLLLGVTTLLASGTAAFSEVKTIVEHNDNEQAAPGFKFKNVPRPARRDAARHANISIIDGERDPAGGDLSKLNDGRVPTDADEPGENFFFNVNTDGGRLLVDLTNAVNISQINTYSWHTDTRAPQVYKLYGSDGTAKDFEEEPKRDTNPEQHGWKLITKVDTRPKEGEKGGQYGVSISDSEGTIGKYRYLLFDCSRTEDDDAFGNTFYSEIDVLDKDSQTNAVADSAVAPFIIKSPDGKCEISIDTSGAPDLKEWAEKKLAPVLAEWYPKIVDMLPSDGYNAPAKFSISIRPGKGVAATGGTRVTANSDWLKNELKGEAIGSLLHEEVHVIQQYGYAPRKFPGATRPPAWMVEGIPDYIRWYKYEPESHGCEITKRNLSRARYDASYRITANFLNYVVEKYDKELIRKMNAAIRDGKYTEDLWKKFTGKTVQDLGDEWKSDIEKKLGV